MRGSNYSVKRVTIQPPVSRQNGDQGKPLITIPNLIGNG
jgi:hypothetical protein